jgi:hypothetical protein
VFNFTVRYLGFLKYVPVLPHLFDTMLRVGSLVSNRKLSDLLDEIDTEVLTWKGTTPHLHKFGGLQYDVNGKEIGHIHGNGLLDILFSKELKEQLIRDGKAIDHHVFKKSGWISFYIRDEHDKNTALELLRKSYEIRSKNSGVGSQESLLRYAYACAGASA